MENVNDQIIEMEIPIDTAPAETLTSSTVSPVHKPEQAKKEDTHNKYRPCEYCQNRVFIQQLTKRYMDECGLDRKPVKIPFLEELAIRLMHHSETILEWGKDEVHHKEFSESIRLLKTYQSLRLQQRVLGRFNPSGAISLLKWHHGMIETEKRILAGDRDEPMQLQIEITDDRPKEGDE